jgi:hypothetical protein
LYVSSFVREIAGSVGELQSLGEYHWPDMAGSEPALTLCLFLLWNDNINLRWNTIVGTYILPE